jgi:HSP20 family protein
MSIKNGNLPHDLLRDLSLDLYSRAGWQPRTDIYRCDEGLLVKLELAGVAEQDLRISLHKETLVVEGRRRDWCIPDAQEPLMMEITYDWFRRTIHLAMPVDPEPMRTEYRDGMLLIYLRSKRDNRT